MRKKGFGNGVEWEQFEKNFLLAHFLTHTYAQLAALLGRQEPATRKKLGNLRAELRAQGKDAPAHKKRHPVGTVKMRKEHGRDVEWVKTEAGWQRVNKGQYRPCTKKATKARLDRVKERRDAVRREVGFDPRTPWDKKRAQKIIDFKAAIIMAEERNKGKIRVKIAEKTWIEVAPERLEQTKRKYGIN